MSLQNKPVFINVPAWAGDAELFASSELSQYLGKITGRTVSVVRSLKNLQKGSIAVVDLSHPASINFIPFNPLEGLKYDGFRIKDEKGVLYIISGEAAGVVHGTYEYLKRFYGCAFLDYGEKGETVPRGDMAEHRGIDITDNPSCWYRSLQSHAGETESALTLKVDWMAKNGFSYLLVRTRKEEPFENIKAWLVPELKKRGIKLAYGHHIFSLIIDSGKFFDERADFYPTVQGEKVSSENLTGNVGKDKQLCWCLSNPDLRETAAYNVIEIARNNPEAEIISLWPDDGRAPVCECRDCRSLITESDREMNNIYKVGSGNKRGDRGKMRIYLDFANYIAEKLAAVYPRVKLSVLAYSDVVDPPANIEIHPNILVCLALYWRCSKHLLTDPRCEINVQYKDIIDQWLATIPPESLYLYTYEMGMGAWKTLPWPVLKKLFEEWPFLKEKGIGGVHIQSKTRHNAVYGINYLAVSRLAREDDVSLNEFLSEYCEKCFDKEGGAFMKRLFMLMEERMERASKPHVLPSPALFLNNIFRKKDVTELKSLCVNALDCTSDPAARWRIERIYSLMEYVAMMAPYQKYWFADDFSAGIEGLMKSAGGWMDDIESFVLKHMALDDDIFEENFVPKMRDSFNKRLEELYAERENVKRP